MPLKKYVKATNERKRYSIDYSDWLDVGELLTNVAFTIPTNNVTTPLVVDDIAIMPDGLGVQYYVSGGAAGDQYEVVATASTTGAQIKVDDLLFTVREPT